MKVEDSKRSWGIFWRGKAALRAWSTYFSGIDHRHFSGVDQLSLSLALSLFLRSRTGGQVVLRLKKVGVHLDCEYMGIISIS